jgi:hypothetical protein
VHATTIGIPAERLVIEAQKLQPLATPYNGRSIRSRARHHRSAKPSLATSIHSAASPLAYPGVEPPKPRIHAARMVDMNGSNARAEFAGIFPPRPRRLPGARARQDRAQRANAELESAASISAVDISNQPVSHVISALQPPTDRCGCGHRYIPLGSSGACRRIGDWRVIFIEDARSITVLAVGNRKEIYG